MGIFNILVIIVLGGKFGARNVSAMQKRKSSRGAVRNTPQHKPHVFFDAVFVDDYGRERALTVSSAASFSKKKLNAASRAMARKADREMDQAIRAGDQETAKAIHKLRKQERESDRGIARFFRRRIRTAPWPSVKLKHKPPKPKLIEPSDHSSALPSYGGFIRDRRNRIGVFLDVMYYSSRTAKPGVAMRVTEYIWRGSALDALGVPMFRSNVGESIEEVICGFDHLEQVNRSAQKGAKVINSAVLALDHRWTREQMLEVGEAWAKERFGQFGLPYALALHEPPPEGDERNWHIHVIWSWRPLERVKKHEWLVSEGMRTDLDGREGMRVLRERFAALSTLMSFRRGDCDIYTALSHAARGLPVEPQKRLYEEKTRRARAGEFVADNEENHERVLRSKAAMIDDDLRREDERLARLQEIERRVAARFAKVVSVPAVPRFAYQVSKIKNVLRKANIELLKRARVPDPVAPAAPKVAPQVHSEVLAASVAMRRNLLILSKFANLRNAKPVPSASPPVPKATTICSRLITVSLPRISSPSLARIQALVQPPKQSFVTTRAPALPEVTIPRLATVRPSMSAPPQRPTPVTSPKLRLPKAVLLKLANARLPAVSALTPRYQTTKLRVPSQVQLPNWARVTAVIKPPEAKSWPSLKWFQSLRLPRSITIPKSAQPVSSSAIPPAQSQPTSRPVAEPAPTISQTTAPLAPTAASAPHSNERTPIVSTKVFLAEKTATENAQTQQNLERRERLIAELKRRPIHVVKSPNGEVRPNIMSVGKNRLSDDDIRDPVVQRMLRYTLLGQESFISWVVPEAILRVTKAQADDSVDAVIKVLPRLAQAEATKWAQTSLWGQVMRQIRDGGLKKSKHLVSDWLKAFDGQLELRCKLAVDASEQTRKWPLRLDSIIQHQMEADAKAYRAWMKLLQSATGSEGGQPSTESAHGKRDDGLASRDVSLTPPSNDAPSYVERKISEGNHETDSEQSGKKMAPEAGKAPKSPGSGRGFPPPGSGFGR